MTKLSVNINKIALIRNSRGEDQPNLLQVAKDCEEFGAEGITVHPRPDERHIRYSDIPLLKDVVQTEFNIEGYPSEDFLKMICANKPHQCTLVPDPPGVLTSSEGWDTFQNAKLLKEVVKRLKDHGIRVSLFLDPDSDQVKGAKETGADRIEFYTGKYAKSFGFGKEIAVRDHVIASKEASKCEIGVNAGHDLNLENLHFYKSSVLSLLEVSIGHALVCDALYFGLRNVIQMYTHVLKK